MYFERKKYVKIRDFWFEDDRDRIAEMGADFAEYHDMPRMPKDKAGFMGKAERLTLVSDLTVDEDAIQASFRKNTRYEIRRVKKEGCKANFFGTEELKQNDELIRKIVQEHAKLFVAKGVRVKDEYGFMIWWRKDNCLHCILRNEFYREDDFCPDKTSAFKRIHR